MSALDALLLSRGELAMLNAIRHTGQLTRADAAAALGLSPAMAARLATRLQSHGLVRDAGRAVSGGPGRQAQLLELEPEAAFVVGIDIGSARLHILVVDLHATERYYTELPGNMLAGLSHEDIVATLARLTREAAGACGMPAERLAAIGISITGIVDSENGVCLVRSLTPGWENFAVAPRLERSMGRPVVIEEMARAKSVAEQRLGAARNAPYFLYVEAGNAIGASIVIDGRPLRGGAGLAGELGHITVDHDGPLCRCGNHGCVQASASAVALVAQARDLLSRGVYSSLAGRADSLTLVEIAEAASGGDKMALGLLNGAGEQLGEAISMALNLLGLDRVVLGGHLIHCHPVVMEAIERVVRLRVLPIVPRERTLERAALGRNAAALGVAVQAIDRLFESLNAPTVEQTFDEDTTTSRLARAVG